MLSLGRGLFQLKFLDRLYCCGDRFGTVLVLSGTKAEQRVAQEKGWVKFYTHTAPARSFG